MDGRLIEPTELLLDPAELAKLRGLDLRARAVVEGTLAGMHRSPHRGQSVEFSEHKEYAPGDELRHIDWKAFGRVDRYYVKRYEDETDLRAYLCVDASASMGYRGRGLSKLEYASVLAAALAHVLLRQQDRVGLFAFRDQPGGPPLYLPPRSHGGQLSQVVTALESLRAQGATDLHAAASAIAERAHRRSVIVLLSDLLDFRDGALDGLKRLRAQRHDVVVLHLLDADELGLPFDEPTLFCGMEDDREVLCDPRALRASYLRVLGAFLEAARSACASTDIEYRLVDTSRPPSEVLVEFLGERSRSRPTRR
ncbi:MAG: DUF58 domain-containing protein [Myxococcota bacterium]